MFNIIFVTDVGLYQATANEPNGKVTILVINNGGSINKLILATTKVWTQCDRLFPCGFCAVDMLVDIQKFVAQVYYTMKINSKSLALCFLLSRLLGQRVNFKAVRPEN